MIKYGVNLGCGTSPSKSTDIIHFANIDIIALEGVNIVHDLNIFPYPFIDEKADLIIMNDILEHLDDPIAVLQECWRILKVGGVVQIKVVHWNHYYSYSDPQHKHAFSEPYFHFFTGEKRSYYMKNHFSGLEITYIFDEIAMKKYSFQTRILLEKAYFHCNIIQGMNVVLVK